MSRMIKCLGFAWALFIATVSTSFAVEPPSRDEVAAAMKRAATYYHDQLALNGGYVYHYSLDLQQRWGEGVASPTQIWVQPPGTPTVGMAYLAAYRATKDKFYLDAARDAASALIYGQLQSGGWRNLVEFDPQSKWIGNYRHGGGRKKGDDNSTLDDDITQSAARFLVQLDEALEFQDATVHDAAKTALDALMAAQFANGAFPQVWTGPVSTQPVVAASYPDYDWRTEGKVKEYWDRYTLNDGVCGTVADLLLEAYRVYKDERYKTALVKLGDFLLLAQLPDPQPAWCQQYGYDMKPIWARKFEPPAVASRESEDAIATLLKVFYLTQDKKYLQPIPRALAFLKKSTLPDGRMPRYFELQTNKPLYMNRDGDKYFLTYDDMNLPDHYGWKIDSHLGDLELRYRQALDPAITGTFKMIDIDGLTRAVAELDAQGRWVSTYAGERLVGQPKFSAGAKYLSSEVFSKNLTLLADYLADQTP